MPATNGHRSEVLRLKAVPKLDRNIVLVLDDNDCSRRTIQMILDTEYRVILADTPEQAISICKSQPPDLLIVDNFLNAPVSGMQTVCRLRALQPELPVLATSAIPTEYWRDDDVDCLNILAGTDRFTTLPKPFTAQALRATVTELMKPHADVGYVAEEVAA